jgi:Protein of unknown function (DUF3306)
MWRARGAPVTDRSPAPAGAPAALPTLNDVAALTPESDFSLFTAQGVDAEVRNAALRKLFHSDPHFGASDGLDVNADEAAASEHSPLERQRQILRARALGMLDDELADQGEAPAEPPAPDAAPGSGGYCGPT